MMYWRRGAVCQSLNGPGGVERNTTPLAPWSALNSGCDARSSSSMCDSPSSPEYKRKTLLLDSRVVEFEGVVYLSLSRLTHWLPRAQADSEVVQGTAEFHDEIADA